MAATERLGLALSGGGFRAAAFHLGVLRGMRAAGRLEEVAAVSGVSGGALLAAAWVVWGADFDAFDRAMRAFLSRDLKWRVALAALRPDRLLRLVVDPRYSLTEVMAAVLDCEVFHGATLGSLQGRRPRLIVNATCLNHGTGWRFTPDRIGDWMLKTEDKATLSAFPVARAVVSSAAFPGGFAPVVLDGRALFPEHPRAPREVLLSDGGVDDNLGVQALFKEESTALVVSDGSYPFESDQRPLDRFGLPLPRRLLVGILLAGLAAWGAARLELPAAALAVIGVLAVAILLRLRLALFLFGSVMMRGQRRGLLRHLFAANAGVPTIYLGLSTALSADGERRLREKGIDVARLRRVRTDLDLRRADVDGLVALGEALAAERLG